MNRRATLAAALLLAGLARSAPKPNVLLVCVDDLKPLLGCFGDAFARTPNVDRLAARGVRFERAYCNQAVCAPSRNALLTGLRPQRIGVYDLPTHFRLAAPDALTVAQHFRRHGYRTEALGKILHVGHGNHEDAASWSVPHWKPGGGQYRLEASTASTRPSKTGGPRGAATECADVPDDAYGDGLIAAEAVRRLQSARQKPDEPFFLAVGFLKPHLPFVAPKKYWDLYDPQKLPQPERATLPEGAPAFAGHTSGELRQYSDMPELDPFTPDQQRRLIHGYYAATSYMDAQLGRVLDALDATGLTQNTVVVFWGDHGWHLGDHGLWCKHTNYEQAARIPVIVAAPGVAKAGAPSRALLETVDIYPTLCELAGLPVPPGLDGASAVPLLRDPAAAGKEAVFHVYPRNQVLGRAVRTARHRLVEWKAIGQPAETAQLELYDYERDPGETRNLAAEQPDAVSALRAILAREPEARPQFRAPKEPSPKAKKGAAKR